MCNAKLTGESATAHKAPAHNFIKKFARNIKQSGHSRRQIFNVEEYRSFRKKTPARTYLAKKKIVVPRNKVPEGILTLLLGGERQVTLKSNSDHCICLEILHLSLKVKATIMLPTIWKSNSHSSVNETIFQNCFGLNFVPEVG